MIDDPVIFVRLLARFIGKIITLTASKVLTGRGEIQLSRPISTEYPILNHRTNKPIPVSPKMAQCPRKLNKILLTGDNTPNRKL
jgi:hypothetical protein